MSETVVILHHKLLPGAGPDEHDVFDQVEAIEEALKDLGYATQVMAFELDFKSFTKEIQEVGPRLVFNVVETPEGDGRLIHTACSILDHLGIPYTGAGVEAMFLTSNKVLAKTWMHRSGIPTAEWVVAGRKPVRKLPFPATYIMKTFWEEASIGIDKDSVCSASGIEDLMSLLRERSILLGKECFAERFIEGREFNVSVLAGPKGPSVLPAAEMTFTFPDDRPKIMNYNAKWVEDSVEYDGTMRTFKISEDDAGLIREINRVSLKCWEVFNLHGYARVDIRVDAEGRPWVLEINANPCITPGSGLPAASEHAGISYREMIRRIIADVPGYKSSEAILP